MSPIEPVTQQSLEDKLGVELATRNCAPVAFYMLLKANGYLRDDLQADEFCLELNSPENHASGGDWSRPALSRVLRQHYGASIVTWQLHGKADFDRMKQSGYLETEEEITFFKDKVWGRSLKEVLSNGYPVIVTMKPGFGTPENKNIHAIILVSWGGDTVTVVDPDARNPETQFDAAHVERFISENGAGTIVLPKP